jgi:hypothetical protein
VQSLVEETQEGEHSKVLVVHAGAAHPLQCGPTGAANVGGLFITPRRTLQHDANVSVSVSPWDDVNICVSNNGASSQCQAFSYAVAASQQALQFLARRSDSHAENVFRFLPQAWLFIVGDVASQLEQTLDERLLDQFE